ncbi:MAG: class I SAM-dependent methyltransferase [Myxococcales bacterium]|nr:class I SAM-dependent methyltransferase [Myxococcales bacterium]
MSLRVVVLLLLVGCRPAQLEERRLVEPSQEGTRAVADAPGTYMGRRIAPTMTHDAADWLIREERDAEENATKMLAELRLAPGDVACDLGAGNGYHTLKMARAVAPAGRAFAVDVQPEMLELLKARAEAAGIGNVVHVLGTQTDTKLPPATCDLVLLADVYHELSDPEAVLASARRALTARGRLVLLEFRAEDPDVPIKPEHKMSKAQILRELNANGFELDRSFDGLPWQHLMFFRAGAR